MMTSLNVARVAKVIALLGFLFPWVLVSCSGAPVGRLTGIDLATGGLGAGAQGVHGDPNFWVLASLGAVIAGLAVSLLARGRAAILAMGALAAIALAASSLGVASAGAEAGPATLGAPSQAASAGGVAHVDLQYGYFITLAGLLVAIGACGVGLASRRRSGAGPPLTGEPSGGD